MSKPVRLIFKRDSDSLACIGFGLAHILKIVKLMSDTWLQFFEGKIDAKAVLKKYKKRGLAGLRFNS